MEYLNFLNSHNVSAFEDVRDLLNNHDIKVKEEGNLYLVYYKREGNNVNPLQYECNGMILEKDTNRIVCNSYNKFCKYNDDVLPKFKSNFDEIVIENCVEGTLLRVYYYAGFFRVATKKCISARNSKWRSEKNYEVMFREAVQNTHFSHFQFEKNKVYFFLLKHPENVSVFNYQFPDLVHLETFRIEGNVVHREDIERVTLFDEANTYEELVYYMNNQTEETMKYQGVVLYNRNDPMLKQRIYFKFYNQMRELYGNESSRFIRFLELRSRPEVMKLYMKYYPQHKKMFIDYEKGFIKFGTDLNNMYVKIRVQKKEGRVQKNFRKLLYDLHGIYLKTRVPVSVTTIINHLMTLDKRLIKFLYENYKTNGLYEINDL